MSSLHAVAVIVSARCRCCVHPQILMRVGDGEQQLYMSVLLDLLRSYQRKGTKPAFPAFKAEVWWCALCIRQHL